MRETFINKNFSAGTMVMIDQANVIIDAYRAQGFVLTLRQLYYQFVARGLIANKQSEYKRLGNIVNDARLAGLIDWEMIEDRTRNLEELPKWNDPQSLIEIAAQQYRSDIWNTQATRAEVWIEKEALTGVVEPICQELRVPYFACRGYGSQSELWRAGHRFRNHLHHGQRVLVLHLGDHDPSGIDMTRDNEERLRMFASVDVYGEDNFEVRRLALNMDQVLQYNPPPNPAKNSDTRFGNYTANFGEQSWELDALEPQVISNLIRINLEGIIDNQDGWDAVLTQEERARIVMMNVASRWDQASEMFGE